MQAMVFKGVYEVVRSRRGRVLPLPGGVVLPVALPDNVPVEEGQHVSDPRGIPGRQ